MPDITHPHFRQVSMSTPEAVSTDLSNAVALHKAGRLEEARSAYEQILGISPELNEAEHGLALIALDLGQQDKAISLITNCISKDPANLSYRFSLGVTLLQAGKPKDAETQFRKLIEDAPRMIEPHLYLARTLKALNRWTERLDVLTIASKQFPNHGDIWMEKGQAERTLLQHAEAEQSFLKALNIDESDPDTLNNLAVVVRAQNRFEEALGLYFKALEIAPDNPKVHGNLGNVLSEMGLAYDAEHHLRKAAHLQPNDISSLYNLAVFLTREERAEEAIDYFNKVIKINPDHSDAWINLGVARLSLGNTQGAEECYRRAIRIAPQNPEANYNLAWVLLLTGRWIDGWQQYEWRWKLEHFSSYRRTFKHPLWDGKPLPEGTLLLHAEQGLGDTIQFVRYAALARERSSHIILECDRSLVPLFKTLPGADEIIAAGDPLPPFDAHAPLMSLARLFATTPETVPSQHPYIETQPKIPGRLRLPYTTRSRIGLVWAGSPKNKIDRQRSMSAKLLAPLVTATDADFVSLQIGPRAGEISSLPADQLIFTCEGKVRDFADSAAVVAQLDLVLGVDTAVIHLAAAMGKPAWVLLPFMPDYRWLLGRNDTPWYPSMSLFRQASSGDWTNLIAGVKEQLRQWLAISTDIK